MKCNKYVIFMGLFLLNQWVSIAYAQQHTAFCSPSCPSSWLQLVLQPKTILWGFWEINEQRRVVPLSIQIQTDKESTLHYYIHWVTTNTSELALLGVEPHLAIKPWGADWNRNSMPLITKYGDKTTK